MGGDAADIFSRDLAVAFQFGVVARRVGQQDGAAAERVGLGLDALAAGDEAGDELVLSFDQFVGGGRGLAQLLDDA